MTKTQASLPKPDTSSGLEKEERAFDRLRPRLLRRYLGQYVGIYRGRVVDYDSNDECLAERLFAKLGNVPFLIVRVEKKPTIYDLPSPEVLD